MMKWMLAAGAAALAMTAPVLADPKGDKGGKGGENKGHSGHAMKADRGGDDRGQKARGGDKARGQAKADNRGRGNDRVRDDNRGRGSDRVRVARDDDDNRGRGRGRDEDSRVVRIDRDRDDVRIVRFDRDDDFRFAPHLTERGLAGGFIDGCPPGLAKKGNGCLPPGQAKKLVGTPLAAALMGNGLAGPYRLWYRDNDDFFYRWDDDYIYRVRRDGGLIDALFPYANNDYYYYPVGAPYPDYFNYYNVPYQYRGYYPDGGDNWYRYGDGAIYMVDPQTRTISGIAALLTGAPLSVGQPLPPTYGVYNVPYAHRTSYFDGPDAWYRYNDGYIYRVDPATQLITAVINAIA